MDFSEYRSQRNSRIHKALERWLPSSSTIPQRLHQAMNYVVLGGGKRIRPLLVYATGEACGAALNLLDIPAVALELIHSYSLVHDDLPAMDDDDHRRGRKTCHNEFDEATAILAGDALQTLAFEILAHDDNCELTAKQRVAMIHVLAQATGSFGMAGGQALDLLAMKHPLSKIELETIHQMKTGALIRASVLLGALASPKVEPLQQRALHQFSESIGLAFQIQDDLLDYDPQNEASRHSVSYPVLVGVEAAIEKVQTLHLTAQKALTCFDDGAKPLRTLADFLLTRKS